MTTLFRIYVERRPNTPSIVARHFDAATILEATGIWKGQLEESHVIELILPGIARDKVLTLAEALRVTYNQESVLVTTTNSTNLFMAELVTAQGVQRV